MQRHKDNEIKNITDVVINCLLQWIMVVIILLMTENTKGRLILILIHLLDVCDRRVVKH